MKWIFLSACLAFGIGQAHASTPLDQPVATVGDLGRVQPNHIASIFGQVEQPTTAYSNLIRIDVEPLAFLAMPTPLDLVAAFSSSNEAKKPEAIVDRQRQSAGIIQLMNAYYQIGARMRSSVLLC